MENFKISRTIQQFKAENTSEKPKPQITIFKNLINSWATVDYKKEGLVTGIGASMFKLAGTVIIFGVVSAYVFGLIRILLFGGNLWHSNIKMYL